MLRKEHAASVIQAAYTGFRQRAGWRRVRWAATIVQACYRRRVSVFNTQRLYDAVQYQARLRFYAAAAARIQAAYRGYASRRDVLNAAERR